MLFRYQSIYLYTVWWKLFLIHVRQLVCSLGTKPWKQPIFKYEKNGLWPEFTGSRRMISARARSCIWPWWVVNYDGQGDVCCGRDNAEGPWWRRKCHPCNMVLACQQHCLMSSHWRDICQLDWPCHFTKLFDRTRMSHHELTWTHACVRKKLWLIDLENFQMPHPIFLGNKYSSRDNNIKSRNCRVRARSLCFGG